MIIHIDPSDITCEHIRRFLYDYVERELDARLLMAMDNHVLACDDCREMVESYRNSVEAVRRSLAQASLPPELKEDLLQALDGRRKQ